MISKSRIKYIRSLEQKKKRREEGLFVAEGPKLVEDLLGCFPCSFLAATESWWMLHEKMTVRIEETVVITPGELVKASLQQHPQEVIALFRQPSYEIDFTAPARMLCLALDGVQDPGNLGTIIRLADWFGIEHIFCSKSTVDAYNPKVVQATMGALARVKVHYLSLEGFIQNLNPEIPIYGTFLEGENLYGLPLSQNGLIIMGNEGNGVSSEIASLVTQKLYIPNYPTDRHTSESLNVAIATAVVCAEFRRRS